MPNKHKEPTPHENRTYSLSQKVALIGLASLIVACIALFKKSPPIQSQTTTTKGDHSAAQTAQTSGNNAPAINSTAPVSMPINSPYSPQINATNSSVNYTINHDLIENTQFTRKQIDDLFPEGHIIVALRNKKWSYDPDPRDELHWRIHPEDVHISPHFEKRQVDWHAKVNAQKNGKNVVENSWTGTEGFPLEVGLVGVSAFSRLAPMGDEPMICFVTLSDNERFSVFAIGYRRPGRPLAAPFR